MNLGETVTYFNPKGVFLSGNIPIKTARAQYLWWEGLIGCGYKSCLSSRCVESCLLGRGGAGDGGVRAGAKCETRFPLCPVTTTVPSGLGFDPKSLTPWEKSYDPPRQHNKKQKHYFANKAPSSRGYGFSSSHVWMWGLDYKESWALKNWWFWTMVLEKTLESPLDCKEIQLVNPKGN